MQWKFPKDDKKYSWTRHVVGKMQYYRISESIVKRIIKSPKRMEKGIAEGTVACMISKRSKRKAEPRTGMRSRPSTGEELWVMYQPKGARKHIITAWRYPGTSPVRDVLPIPEDILEEIKNII